MSRDAQIAWVLLTRSTIRHWVESKWSYLLLILIVAVGVGSLNGIRQASRAATANFGLFNQAVSGQSDFLMEAPVGALQEQNLQGLAEVSRNPAWHLFSVIEGPLTQLDEERNPTRQLRLIGIDLVAVANLPRFIEQEFRIGDEQGDWHEWVGDQNQIWVTATFLERSGLQVGDVLPASVAGSVHQLRISGSLGSPGSGMPDDLVLMDIPAAQALLSRPGELDRIEVIVHDREQAADPEALAHLEAQLTAGLPEGLELRPSAERAADRAGMTEAFRMNLIILSLIAMLVGAYLILQALDAAVVRRRGEIATLKSLGVSGTSILVCLLLEAALIGLLGSFLGVGFGYLLASGAVYVLADTVNALYFATSVESIQLTAADVWIGFGIGFLFSLLAGWLPARDAMSTPPAQILSRGDWSPGFAWLRSPGVGLGLLLLGFGCLLIPPPLLEEGARFPIGGFLAAGCWIFGAALLSGEVMVMLSWLIQKGPLGAAGRIAVSRLGDGSSRHRLAVAGLVVAVGMVTGILQMVGSFRGTIEEWFDVRFQAELYVSERGSGGMSSHNGIDPDLMASLSAKEDVQFADTFYVSYVEAPRGITVLGGVAFEAWKTDVRQIWRKAPGELQALEGAQPAMVSEAFARRFDVLDGGTVELITPSGPRTVTPIGIFSDYGNEFGTAVIEKTVWREWTGQNRPINSSLYLVDGVDVNEVRDALRLEFPGLDIRNAQELRDVALGIFDETFRVTTALNGIGITVAMAGLLLGLLAIFTESAGTWQTLKHLGFSSRGYLLTAGLEGAGIALSGWVGGTAIGLALGWLLIHVINVQSFGWTLIWNLPLSTMLGFGVAMVLTGWASGIVTGWWWHGRAT